MDVFKIIAIVMPVNNNPPLTNIMPNPNSVLGYYKCAISLGITELAKSPVPNN